MHWTISCKLLRPPLWNCFLTTSNLRNTESKFNKINTLHQRARCFITGFGSNKSPGNSLIYWVRKEVRDVIRDSNELCTEWWHNWSLPIVHEILFCHHVTLIIPLSFYFLGFTQGSMRRAGPQLSWRGIVQQRRAEKLPVISYPWIRSDHSANTHAMYYNRISEL